MATKLESAQKALEAARQRGAPQSDIDAAQRLVTLHQKGTTPTFDPTAYATEKGYSKFYQKGGQWYAKVGEEWKTAKTREEAKEVYGIGLGITEAQRKATELAEKVRLEEERRASAGVGDAGAGVGAGVGGAGAGAGTTVVEDETKPFDWGAFTEEQEKIATTSEEARKKEREEYKEELKEELGVGEMPPKPPPADFESDYEALRSEKGMEALETQINDLSSLMRDTEAALREGLYDEEGKLRPMELIGTRQRELTRQVQETMDTYTRRKATLVDEYNVKANVINTAMNLKQMDYNAAVASYNADFNRAIKIIDMVEGYETKQIAMDNQVKTNAQANLSVIEKIMSETNQSWDDLDVGMQTQIATLEMKAGLPTGTFELLMASVDTTKDVKTTTYSKDKSQVHVIYDDGTMEVFSTGLTPEVPTPPTPPTSYKEWELAGGKAGTGKTYAEWLEKEEEPLSETEELKQAKVSMKAQLMGVRGKDGYISPKDYKTAKEAWHQAGLGKDKFDEYFNMFANPTHRQDYEIAY